MMDSLTGQAIGAYARFSSDKQSDTSAVAQIARIDEWVRARDGQLSDNHVYRDEALSGATDQRPGLVALMAAVDSARVHVVVVEDLSRLSRDLEHAAAIRKRFEFAGVRLIGIADGIDTLGNGASLLYGVKAILSEQYLKDLGDKTSRGMRDRARLGRVTGALPYGYASQPAPDGHGKVAVVMEEQAEVVRCIFKMREAGRSYRDIAKTLNEEGIEPPRGRQKDSRKRRDGWVLSGVRAVLRNEKYRGHWAFGARSWKKSPVTGKRVKRPAAAPLIEVDLPELRIVDEDTWLRVQAINEAARDRYALCGPSAYAREGGASTAHRVYPMSTLVRCGVCGGPMVIEKTERPRYRCDGSRGNGGSCENSATVMEKALREAFTEAMLRHFGGPHAGEALHEDPATESADVLNTVPNERERAALQLSDTRRRIENLIELASEGTAPVSVLDKIRELEALAGQQQRRLCEVEATVQPLDVPEQQEIVARIRHLRALFRTSPKDARQALKQLLHDGIELFPLEQGRYRASWAVRVGGLGSAETVSTTF